MRSRLVAGALVGLLGVGVSWNADAAQRVLVQARPNPALSGVTTRQAPARPSKPFSNLFQPTLQPPAAPAAGTPGKSGVPYVACGMTLVPVDPKFDPAIRKQAPLEPAPAVKAMKPPDCQR